MNDKKEGMKIILFLTIVAVFLVSCAPETDIKPPETIIERIQTVYGLAGVDIILNGTDDKTPPEKLTYEYQIYSKNNEALELTFSDKVQENLISYRSEIFEEGYYLIRVFAINEFGIKDKTPAEASFRIDLTPPPSPVVSYQLKSGKVHFSCLEDEVSDAEGYEMTIFDSDEAKSFSTTEEDFVFSAEKGERYVLKIRAIDFAGNASEEKEYIINTDVDDAPVIESELPVLLGRNNDSVDFIVYDDWDSTDLITQNATFSGIPLRIEAGLLKFDLSTVSEGTHTLFVSLDDAKGHQMSVEKDIYVDLTPPDTPIDGKLKESNRTYHISWENASDEETVFRIYGFNKMEDKVFLCETSEKNYKTDERYLHYVVSAVDKAGNESSSSYPIRTYNEKYVPITSSKIGMIEENTLLTSLYSPYRVNSEIVISDELMLAIEKGVEIIFENGGALKVYGQVLSIPSNSEKKRLISTGFSKDYIRSENIIDIIGGAVWLNDFEISGDPHTDLFAIHDGGELRAQSVSVKGFRYFIDSADADIVLMDNSEVQTTVFATGTDCADITLNKVTVNADAGINILNIKNLVISHCTIDSKEFALKLDGFSNAMLNHSAFSADEALIMNKLSAADAKAISLNGVHTALALKGASSINLRNSTLNASETAIYVDRSAYLCAIESTVTKAETGICTMNSDIVLKDVTITENASCVNSSLKEDKTHMTGSKDR